MSAAAAVRIGAIGAEDGALAFVRARSSPTPRLEQALPRPISTTGDPYRALLAAYDRRIDEAHATLGDPQTDVAEIERTLGADPAQAEAAVRAFTGLSSLQQHAIANSATTILHGGVPSLSTVAPLIAGALALTGVGAPAVAIVAALLPIGDAIFAKLGLAGGPEECRWKVNSALCFKGRPPSSATDPFTGAPNPAWRTWDEYLRENAGILGAAEAAFPGWGLVWCEVPKLDASDRLAQFLLTYYAALVANVEQAINGHPFVAWPGTTEINAQAIFDTTVSAWNLRFASPPFAEMRAAPAPVVHYGEGAATCAEVAPGDFVRALLNGDIDGRPHDPVRIATGPQFVHLPHLPPKGGGGGGKPGGKGASGGAGAGTGLAVAGAGLGALWFVLGRPGIHQIIDGARRLFSKG